MSKYFLFGLSLAGTMVAQYIPPGGQSPPSGNPPKTAFRVNEYRDVGKAKKAEYQSARKALQMIASPEYSVKRTVFS